MFFIDIAPGKQIEGIKKHSILTKVAILLKYLATGKLYMRVKEALFFKRLDKTFEGKIDNVGKTTIDLADLDAVVIGSDEVFNCCQISDWGFTTQLYGDIPEAKKIITYAASFGNTTKDELLKYKLDLPIRKSMANLSSISVRDLNSLEIVNWLGFEAQINIDPVLIWDWTNELKKLREVGKDYILLYSYPGRINDKDEVDDVIAFAKAKNLPIIPILSEYSWCEDTIFPDPPIEVLRYFKSAKYIITDTFHGTIFSIITEKQFCTIIRESNYQKLTSLLDKFNLSKRAYNKFQSLVALLDDTIDYDYVRSIRLEERNKTEEYLSKKLK